MRRFRVSLCRWLLITWSLLCVWGVGMFFYHDADQTSPQEWEYFSGDRVWMFCLSPLGELLLLLLILIVVVLKKRGM